MKKSIYAALLAMSLAWPAATLNYFGNSCMPDTVQMVSDKAKLLERWYDKKEKLMDAKKSVLEMHRTMLRETIEEEAARKLARAGDGSSLELLNSILESVKEKKEGYLASRADMLQAQREFDKTDKELARAFPDIYRTIKTQHEWDWGGLRDKFLKEYKDYRWFRALSGTCEDPCVRGSC